MDRSALVLVFDHLIQGFDIPRPAGMLKVSGPTANRQLPDLPYSLATNLAHTLVWQEFWLAKLNGGRRKAGPQASHNDFRVPSPDEFPRLRRQFLEGLDRARAVAASEPFDHKLPTDEEAVDTLVRIAVHAAYHVGQMNVLKRSARLAEPEGVEDE
jgi:uncharacterized damage-inducible protein DinB